MGKDLPEAITARSRDGGWIGEDSWQGQWEPPSLAGNPRIERRRVGCGQGKSVAV
jgi:hypothetical protein